MRTHVNRRTVDLSGYPDLVVVYLGNARESHYRDENSDGFWAKDFVISLVETGRASAPRNALLLHFPDAFWYSPILA